MGPPSLDGGEPLRSRGNHWCPPGFNGAPVSRRGGGGHHVPGVQSILRASMGPRLSTGGRRACGARGPTVLVGFNGAPVSRRGGGRAGECGAAGVSCASMAPPVSRRGGGLDLVHDHQPLQLASMGPPSSDGGEGGGVALRSARYASLQWGPRLSTGGSCRGRRPGGGTARGFNGAPVSRRGGGFLIE